MFDYEGIRSIEISYEDLQALLQKVANNPIAENEIPAMLRDAIRRGIPVTVRDPTSEGVFRLVLHGDKFGFEPMLPLTR